VVAEAFGLGTNRLSEHSQIVVKTLGYDIKVPPQTFLAGACLSRGTVEPGIHYAFQLQDSHRFVRATHISIVARAKTVP